MAYSKPPKRTEQEWRAFHNYLKHPVEAVKDWFKITPDDWQGDMLEGLFLDKDRVAIKSAHGTGKSAVDAWAGWIFLNGYENCRMPLTAPTFSQLHDVLIPEFAKWHGKMPDRMQNEWMISGGHIRHKCAPYEWFAVARTSNRPANLQGFHNANLLIVGDEGSGIPPNVFEVMEGALSEAGDEGKIAKLILTGNPNFAQGELFDAFNRNSDLYHQVTVTGDIDWFKSLGIKQGDFVIGHGRVYYSSRVKQKYVDTMRKKYGDDSAVFDVRVRGIFPRAADDTVIPWEWANRARLLPIPTIFDPIADGVTLVVDPSRGGGAESVIGTFRRGYCIELDGFKHSSKSMTPLKVAIKEKVIRLTGQGLRIINIIVDEPGVGGMLIDDLRADGLPVTAYNGGQSLKLGVDPEDDIRMFANRRSRDWWHIRRLLETNLLPLPDDEVLVAQMTSLKFFYNGQEKIVCESKDDLKDRLGKEASPDRADVIVMGKAPFYSAAAVHATLQAGDIICGKDRPQFEFDL